MRMNGAIEIPTGITRTVFLIKSPRNLETRLRDVDSAHAVARRNELITQKAAATAEVQNVAAAITPRPQLVNDPWSAQTVFTSEQRHRVILGFVPTRSKGVIKRVVYFSFHTRFQYTVCQIKKTNAASV